MFVCVYILHIILTKNHNHTHTKQGVQWAENVVDNELLGKKKSKKCCIFHKQRMFGDWSDSDSDIECDECNNSNNNDENDAAPPVDV